MNNGERVVYTTLYLIMDIDTSRLKRDYEKDPLKFYFDGNTNRKELPYLEDVEYMYLELNMSYRQIAKYLGICKKNMLSFLKEHNIKKPLKQSIDCRANVLKNKYGTSNIGLVEEIANRKKETNMKKYGNASYVGSDDWKKKAKQTCMEKYGVESYTQTKEYKTRVKQTCMEKYGVEYVSQTNDFRNNVHITKLNNKTYTKSKPESQIYEVLLDCFSQTIRQYKSEKYPFACDFYVPELDLYIEYQGFWKHGKEPYDNMNINHQKILEQWKKKSNEKNFKGEYKKSYIDAIKTWTISDPLKRQIAKDNGLNWLEFFNMKQFNDWIKNNIEEYKNI